MSITNTAIRGRVHRAVDYWRSILGLDSWDLSVSFDEVNDLGNCNAKPVYEEAILGFNLARIRAELPPSYAAIEELVLHEMVHCFDFEASERKVSRYTRSLLRARDSGKVRKRVSRITK